MDRHSNQYEKEFRIIFDAYKNRLFGYVLAISHSHYTAEEITQEIFLKLWLCDLHTSKVIERPKVIYNDKTKQFVMWMHIDSEDYAYARAGVAVSDNPAGPYRYLQSVRPNGNMSRDMTIYKDDDGKAYHFYASESNKTMRVAQLSDDYLSHTTNEKRILIGLEREAPAIFKHN